MDGPKALMVQHRAVWGQKAARWLQNSSELQNRVRLIFFKTFVCHFWGSSSFHDRDKVRAWENPENLLVLSYTSESGCPNQAPLFVETSRFNFLDSLRNGPYLHQTLHSMWKQTQYEIVIVSVETRMSNFCDSVDMFVLCLLTFRKGTFESPNERKR